MFFSRWHYSTTFWFLLPKRPLVTFKSYFPPSAASVYQLDPRYCCLCLQSYRSLAADCPVSLVLGAPEEWTFLPAQGLLGHSLHHCKGQCRLRGQPGTCGHLCHVWRSHGLCCCGQTSRGLTNGRLCDWRESLAGPLPGLPSYSWPGPLVAAGRLESRAPPPLCSQVLWGYKLSSCSWGIQNQRHGLHCPPDSAFCLFQPTNL